MHPVLRVGLHYVFFLRRVASYLVLVVHIIAVDVFYFIRFGVGRRLLVCGIFFSDALRRILLVVVDVFYLIRFEVGRGLLLCFFFSDALRRIFFFLFFFLFFFFFFLLLLMYIISSLDLGVAAALYCAVFFSRTRCVCVSSWRCCCYCNTAIVNCSCYLANLEL